MRRVPLRLILNCGVLQYAYESLCHYVDLESAFIGSIVLRYAESVSWNDFVLNSGSKVWRSKWNHWISLREQVLGVLKPKTAMLQASHAHAPGSIPTWIWAQVSASVAPLSPLKHLEAYVCRVVSPALLP